MAIDMKKVIADAVRTLLIDKKKKRITVKDIVEECNITRQAFYYHFADIPELLQWMATQKAEELKLKLSKDMTEEEAMKYMLLMFINAKPEIERGIASNYGDEMGQIIQKQLQWFFREAIDEECPDMGDFEKDLFARYHCYAVLGLLCDWTEEDTENIDRIVHDICLMCDGRVTEIQEN